MKLAYLDCASGISGDMFLGALVDAGVPLEKVQAGIDSLQLPGCRLQAREVQRHGFRCLKVTVQHPQEHTHRHLQTITDLIQASQIVPQAKSLACEIFTRLGRAEARVHGTDIRHVHFHEVGAADSIADIVGAAIAWTELGIQRLVCSPIPTGSGTFAMAHGTLSIPAPATAELLRGVPLAPSPAQTELTTPTGAAIATTLAAEFGPLPALTIRAIGYGAGDRDLPHAPNVLRLLWGDGPGEAAEQSVCLLETNIDDISPEIVAYALERAFQVGALDAYATPIQMKKNRPAVQLSVLCTSARQSDVEAVLFRETGTLGIRHTRLQRTCLPRQTVAVRTPWGNVAGKLGQWPDGSGQFHPEFEACRAVAQRHQVPLWQVFRAAEAAFDAHRIAPCGDAANTESPPTAAEETPPVAGK